MLRAFLTWFTTVALGYGVLVGFLYLRQDRMVYLPGHAQPDLARNKLDRMSPVTLATADGLDLLAWYAEPVSASAAVLVYLHGNGGHIGMRVDKLRPYVEAGYGVLLVEYRGYGGNPGKPSESGLYLDGRAAIDFLAERGVGPGRIVLYGESLGGAVAIELAQNRDFAALVVEAPFTSLVDVGSRVYPWLPIRLLSRDRYDNLAKVARLRAPLIVVHGEADRLVPPSMGRAVLAASVGPAHGIFVAGASHDDLVGAGAPDQILRLLERYGVRAQ